MTVTSAACRERGTAYTDGADIFVAESPEPVSLTETREIDPPPATHEEMSSRAKIYLPQALMAGTRREQISRIYTLPPARKKMYAGAPTPHANGSHPDRHARYIAKRIESIMEQTYPNIDLVVIDDFSRARSDEILRGPTGGSTYFVRQANAEFFCTAWEFAQTTPMTVLSGFCESDPEFVERGVQTLRQYSNGSVLLQLDGDRHRWQAPRERLAVIFATFSTTALGTPSSSPMGRKK